MAKYVSETPDPPAGSGEAVLALTFDDGPDPQVTPQVLDVLGRYGVLATFAVTGSQASAHPDLVRRIASEGHALVNHTWNHANLRNRSEADFANEVDRTSELLTSLTGRPVRCLRPPQGAYDSTVLRRLAARGLTALDWSIDPRDWQNPPASTITARVLDELTPGAIAVLHDYPRRWRTLEALPSIIEGAQERGYRMVPVCGGWPQVRDAGAGTAGRSWVLELNGRVRSPDGRAERLGPIWSSPLGRGVAIVSGADGGWVLDAYGGLHPFGGAPGASVSGYWWGWDIARDVALRPAGGGGWVLDGFGGLHPFGGAPPVNVSAYWSGWDIARRLVVRPSGGGGWVLDAFGGLHPFGDAPRVKVTGYWPGWAVARDVALRLDGKSGWVLDAHGGLHPFGGASPVRTTGYWPGRDSARAIVLASHGEGGWVVDLWGRRHPFSV